MWAPVWRPHASGADPAQDINPAHFSSDFHIFLQSHCLSRLKFICRVGFFKWSVFMARAWDWVPRTNLDKWFIDFGFWIYSKGILFIQKFGLSHLQQQLTPLIRTDLIFLISSNSPGTKHIFHLGLQLVIDSVRVELTSSFMCDDFPLPHLHLSPYWLVHRNTFDPLGTQSML